MRALCLLGIAACWHGPAVAPAVAVFEGVALERSTCSEGLLVPVEIDGVRGMFMLDSGAFVNVVYEPFAKRAKLATEDNFDRVGGGQGVRVLRVVPRTFSVPGIFVANPPTLMMLGTADSPLAREGCDIAGVISPATLATVDTALIVDFAARRLAQIPHTAIDDHLQRVSGPRFTAITNENEYTPGITVAFGDQQLRMMIDTGACCTWVATSSVVGRAKLRNSVAGGKVKRLLGTTPSRVSRVDLRFGGVARTLQIKLLEPDAGDSREAGAIGADALSSCVVAIRTSEIRGACR